MMKSFNRSAPGAGVVGVLAAAGLCGGAGAQWTVTRLAPGEYGSSAAAISGNLQVGSSWDFRHFTGAAAWAGRTNAWVRLGCQCMYSAAHGVRDGEVVGYGELSARPMKLRYAPASSSRALTLPVGKPTRTPPRPTPPAKFHGAGQVLEHFHIKAAPLQPHVSWYF